MPQCKKCYRDIRRGVLCYRHGCPSNAPAALFKPNGTPRKEGSGIVERLAPEVEAIVEKVTSGADLSGAYLRSLKADFFMILALGHREVPALISALRDGRVDGSTYIGDCACLVGTLENAGAFGLPRVSSSPAEQWFVPIRKGVKPGDEGEGGFRSATALEWALEYCAATGIELPVIEAA